MWLVFTDLDGTLLEHETYSFEPARPALDRLRRLGVPLVLTTSKTRAEVEIWRRRLDNHDPFIVENGGGIFVPRGYFPFPPAASETIGSYDVIPLGDHYKSVVDVLVAAADEARCRVKGFHEMTLEDVSAACNVGLEEARLAKQREFDEVFEIMDSTRVEALLQAIERRGKGWTRGGRFYHVMGNSDKAAAVATVHAWYRKAFGPVTTIGLGDGLNDAPFLNVVDIPILVRSGSAAELQNAVPRGRLTEQCGPEGWNQALLQVIPE